ncbi:MAG: D-alanyl-D-alanine carboxypeptidase/D-alanyl-D-alanine-endopeptidase, partial [bacterium]|nr:D-alanyl-D-alanine carboxypeptidase/D-alanyl-D-alanine-endopeptidase [bacterium]
MSEHKSIKYSYLLLFVLLLNCTSVKELPHKTSLDRLRDNIDVLLDDPRFYHGNIGLMIESLDSGETIYQKNAHKLFMPASNMKLFTTAASLVRLGPDYKFETELLISGDPLQDGTLRGDLLIIGSGDPSFGSTYFLEDPAEIFERWIEELKMKGIRRIEGNIVGDDNIFDDTRFGAGWEYGDLQYSYAAPIGGLCFADNCIKVTIIPGLQPGDTAIVRIEPDISLFTLKNNAVTVEPARIQGVRSSREVGKRVINISGTISIDHTPVSRYLTVENPTIYTTTVLKEQLERNGIEVTGNAVDIDDLGSEYYSDKEWETIGLIESPELHEIINILNKVSHNFFADQLLKTLGSEFRDSGSFSSGITVLKGFLSSAGIDPTNYFQYDGSGLSRYTLVMPVQIMTLLKYMKGHRYNDHYFSSLPVAGVDGTIENRMKDSPA